MPDVVVGYPAQDLALGQPFGAPQGGTAADNAAVTVTASVVNPLHGKSDQKGAAYLLSVDLKEDCRGAMLLTLTAPVRGPAPKLDICLVIDTSGSMSEAANPSGKEGINLFSKMDLAKRAMEIIARALGPDDSLTIISFNSQVEKTMPRTKVDPEGLEQALLAIKMLQPGGGTALWDGLCTGLNEMETNTPSYDYSHRLPVLVLLTDGQPSSSPAGGEIAALKKLISSPWELTVNGDVKSSQPRNPCKMVTMGFGYDVNSKLLAEISDTHGGLSPRQNGKPDTPGVGHPTPGHPTPDTTCMLDDGSQNAGRHSSGGSRQGGGDLATGTAGGSFGNDFAFIPDGSMLLTTFVNLMANLQSTCARDTVLHIRPLGKPACNAATIPTNSTDLAEHMEAAFQGLIVLSSSETKIQDQDTAHDEPVDIPSLVSIPGEVAWEACPALGGTGLDMYLGDVLYGQPRHVVLRAKDGALVDWNLWDLQLSQKTLVPGNYSSAPLALTVQPSKDVSVVTQQLHRAMCISSISHAARIASVDIQGAQEVVKQSALATMALQGGPLLQGALPHSILEDMLGQLSEGMVSRETWSHWGQHFVRSLISAHRAQACNNFKDPGVLAYGGEYTQELRDRLSTMCDALPVPMPSIRPCNSSQARTVDAQTYTASFNSRVGGCFGKDGTVLLADGTTKLTQHIRKGDVVRTAWHGGANTEATAAATATATGPATAHVSAHVPAHATVCCVIKYSGVATLKLPGSGLVITPWHPVRSAGTWHFPADLASGAPSLLPQTQTQSQTQTLAQAQTQTRTQNQPVYNYVLDSGHIVTVNGVECVTLGHSFQQDVVRHPFFGSSAVVEELEQLPGWDTGLVVLDEQTSPCKIDAESGLVCGLQC